VPIAAEQELQGSTRRRFFVGAIYGIWASISAALALPASVYLLFPPKARNEDQWVDAGDISKLAPNAPVELTFRRNRVDGWKVLSEKSTAWVVRQADSSVVAYGPQCTHLGCAYHWEEGPKEFLCPCHNSLFGLDGKVQSGPAPRSLDRYDVKLQGSRLLIGPLRKSEGA
jgi:menaquinol-cytochrome c reductase iron-sulfur subunit